MVQRRVKKSEINPATYLENSQNDIEHIPQLTSRAFLLPQTARALSGAFSKSSPWLTTGMISCSVAGAITLIAYRTLTMVPPLINCAALSSPVSDRQALQCAQEAAQSGELSALLSGLALLGEWTAEDPLYAEAQKWLQKWSESVLTVANQNIKAGNLQKAIELAAQIPESSPAYVNAQAALMHWRQANQQIEAITAEVHEAMKWQDWDLASEKISALNALNNAPGRSSRVSVLLQQLAAEKQGRRHISQARELAQTNDPQQLSAAVKLLGQLNPETDAWADVQPELNQWGKTLLAFGAEQWRQGNLDEALAIAEQIAFIHSVSREARHLKHLSQAGKLAIATANSGRPSPIHLFNLMEAMAAARQIPPDSQFYPQAQANLQNWAVHLQDVTHLQIAQLSASLELPTSFDFAIGLAQQIAPDRPRRLQAQTLIAHWRTEIERLEDRHYLVRAQKLAEPGTIPSLQAAIAEAGKVSIGRPLRQDAQAMIYDWNQEIEAIVDQPFLTLAQTLAKQGKLRDAIETAAAILPGRALHPQAQVAMQDWRRQIRNRQRARRQAGSGRVNPPNNASNRNGNRNNATNSPAIEATPNSNGLPTSAIELTGESSQESGGATPTIESLLQSLPANTSPPSSLEISPPIEASPSPVEESAPLIPATPSPALIEAPTTTIEFTPPRD